MLDREHAPRAAEAALDLVGDQHDAVGVTDAAQPPQELRRRGIEAALAEHRLDDDRRDARGIDVRPEQLLERAERMLDGDTVIRHREGQVVDLRQQRSEPGLVGLHLAGEADAGERAAVEAAREGDQRGAPRVKARDLDGVLDRFRAGGEKDGLLGGCARSERVQCFRERDVALIGGHLEAGVGEFLKLPRDSLMHLRVHVPGVEHRDAAREVDVAAALHIPQLRIGGPLGVHGERVGHAARHGLETALVQFGVRRHGSPLQASLWRASGSERRRRPLAAWMALQTAGATRAVDGSPMPPGGALLSSSSTSMRGISLIRSTR